MKRTASNAFVQVAAQGAMLQKFGEAIGKKLATTQVLLDGILVQIDGYCETSEEIVLAECWAHIGKAKVAQKHKIAADVLKLSIASFAIRKQHPEFGKCRKDRICEMTPKHKVAGHAAGE